MLVEREFREGLALSYLLLRLGWQEYRLGPGPQGIMAGPKTGWEQYDDLLCKWLAPTS